MFVGEEFEDGDRIFSFADECAGEFLDDVALESAGGVEGCAGEGGDEDAHERDGGGGGDTHGLEEVGGAVDEGSDLGGESLGGSP